MPEGLASGTVDCCEDRHWRDTAYLVEPPGKGHNIRGKTVFLLLTPSAAGQFLRLDGYENGDVHQCDLTLQENRGTELEAFKLILETPKSYVFMGCHVMAGHECMVCNI